MRLRSRDLFQTVRTEGGLLPADLLARIADNDPSLTGLAPADYHLLASERITEVIARAWTRLTAAWRDFDEQRQRLPKDDPASGLTREAWLLPLFRELDYGRLSQSRHSIEIEGKAYPIFTDYNGNVPIHLLGAGASLDARTAGLRGAAGQSPHSLVQELLNRSTERLWGIVTNGLVLRVLRDNVTLTRQAYVQFDLEAMFTGEVYSDFVLLWLVCHQSRFEASNPEECWLEQWTRTAADTGTRALDSLRQGVEEAIKTLGSGFLAHPTNKQLQHDLQDGTLTATGYYRTLLRLVYRLLFLFVAEDRGALLDPNADALAKARYAQHYSTAQLRRLSGRRRGGRHHDRYEQLKLVMAALHEDGEPRLALPALGSYLWDPAAIGPLATAHLANEDLFGAVRSLATVEHNRVRRAVDFANLGAEELGSVYESLLELHPTIDRTTAGFALDAVAGSERKSTGSYYTPTSLISSLLDTALEPVLDEAARTDNAEQAILGLAVVDPACGSGHFLIAAANRIAKRLAAIRSDDPEPTPEETRAALRDVVGHCIHGVDVNPMAVELCKVSLWMEALEPGRPLSFLDHRIVLGNSLLGTTPELIAGGIPDDAFRPIRGDDNRVAAELRDHNKKQRAGQLSFDMTGDRIEADAHALAAEAAALARLNDQSMAGVRDQQQRFQQLLGSSERRRAQLAADTWCAAFVAPKVAGVTAITQDTLIRMLSVGARGPTDDELAMVAAASERYSFLHWHIAFPAVWEQGGFDVVLGNPPWDQIQFREEEFFAAVRPDIAAASTTAARERMVQALRETDPILAGHLDDARRQVDGTRHFVRASGRYPLCSHGRVNTFGVLAETAWAIVNRRGRVGVIVPTGIATDDSMKRFFQAVVSTRALVSLYDFENRDAIFAGVHRSYKFCLLTVAGRGGSRTDEPEFVFFARATAELSDRARRITLTQADIALLNPETRTCPIFRSVKDARIARDVYRRLPIIASEISGWSVTLRRFLNMSDDSAKFVPGVDVDWQRTGVSQRAEGALLRVYEAKLFHHFDHRWATYAAGEAVSMDEATKRDPNQIVRTRYAVPDLAMRRLLGGLWSRSWFLLWRDICRSTDERTLIATVVPFCAHANPSPAILVEETDAVALAPLQAVLSSFVLDYIVRLKIGGTHLAQAILSQLPVLPKTWLAQLRPEVPTVGSLGEWLTIRVLELAYTATDLAGFAADIGFAGQPFRWDPDRRALIRAELDAAMFRLYGIARDDLGFIMETFPIVRRRDEDRFGEYRTKRLILERYDAMRMAETAGVIYDTPLHPPPGDVRAEHQAADRDAVQAR